MNNFLPYSELPYSKEYDVWKRLFKLKLEEYSYNKMILLNKCFKKNRRLMENIRRENRALVLLLNEKEDHINDLNYSLDKEIRSKNIIILWSAFLLIVFMLKVFM